MALGDRAKNAVEALTGKQWGTNIPKVSGGVMAHKQPGRKPHYSVGCLHKGNEARSTVGAAWLNDDGTISVKINPFVVLPSGPDLVITLFPRREDRDERDTEIPF